MRPGKQKCSLRRMDIAFVEIKLPPGFALDCADAVAKRTRECTRSKRDLALLVGITSAVS